MVLIPFWDRFDYMGNHTFDPKAGDLRRIEVISGAGRRRRWTTEAKAQIVAESLAGDASVSEIARRHGMRPQQLFGWRHQARSGRLALAAAGLPAFVPIVADRSGENAALASAVLAGPSSIEIELRGMIVRVRGRVAAEALAEVLAAVKSVL
jgi:transposase